MFVLKSTIRKAIMEIEQEIKSVTREIDHTKNILDTHKLDVKERIMLNGRYIESCKIKDGLMGALCIIKNSIGDFK